MNDECRRMNDEMLVSLRDGMSMLKVMMGEVRVREVEKML